MWQRTSISFPPLHFAHRQTRTRKSTKPQFKALITVRMLDAYSRAVLFHIKIKFNSEGPGPAQGWSQHFGRSPSPRRLPVSGRRWGLQRGPAYGTRLGRGTDLGSRTPVGHSLTLQPCSSDLAHPSANVTGTEWRSNQCLLGVTTLQGFGEVTAFQHHEWQQYSSWGWKVIPTLSSTR